jgi:hypothetical protein
VTHSAVGRNEGMFVTISILFTGIPQVVQPAPVADDMLTLMISTSWSTPDSPGKSGWPNSSSATTHPTDLTEGRQEHAWLAVVRLLSAGSYPCMLHSPTWMQSCSPVLLTRHLLLLCSLSHRRSAQVRDSSESIYMRCLALP